MNSKPQPPPLPLRYNPKAAALYAHLCLVVGAILLAFAWFQKLKNAFGYATRPSTVLFVAGIALCGATYLFCMTLYVAHLFAMRRGGTKNRALWVAAAVCALPCFSPFVLACRSLKTHSRASFVCALVLLCELALIAYEAVFDVPVVSAEFYLTLFVCASVVAIYCMKDGLDAGAGGLIPATATLVAYAILLRVAVSAETTRVVAESGMPRIHLTVEEIANGYTNGVVLYDDSVRALEREIRAIETPERIRDNWSVWDLNDDDVPLFREFFATHSNLIERVNALTSRENLSFAHTNIVGDVSFAKLNFAMEIRDATVFLRFNRRMMTFDAYTQNIDGVLAGNARAQNIFHAMRSPPFLVYLLSAGSSETRRMDALQNVIPHLDDETLRALKAQATQNVDALYFRTRAAIEFELMHRFEIVDALRKRIPEDWQELSSEPTSRRFRSLLKNTWQSTEKRIFANCFREMLVAMQVEKTDDADNPRLNGQRYLENGSFWNDTDSPFALYSERFIIRMFVPHVYHEFKERSRLFCTAVDVELYRRKYGALPETLDALVPEFIPRVPVSYFSEKPFALEKGTLTQSVSDDRDEDKTFEGFRVTNGTPAGDEGKFSYSVIDAMIDKTEK